MLISERRNCESESSLTHCDYPCVCCMVDNDGDNMDDEVTERKQGSLLLNSTSYIMREIRTNTAQLFYKLILSVPIPSL